MKAFSIHNSEGKLVRTGYCPADTFDLQAGPGETVSEGVGQWETTEPVLSYATKRIREYPPVTEQLDALWHAMNTGTFPKAEPFFSSIKAVKDRNPKN